MTRAEYTTTYSPHEIPHVLYSIGGFNLTKSSLESETEFVSWGLCDVLENLDETESKANALGHFITFPCLNMKERTVSWRFQEQPELLDMLCKKFGWDLLSKLLQKHSGSLGLQSFDKMISLVPTTGIINCFDSFFYECTDWNVHTCLLSVVAQRLAVPEFRLFDDHLKKWKAILNNCSKYDKYDIKSYNGSLDDYGEQKYFCDVVQFFLRYADSRICVTLLNDASFLLGTRNDFAPVIVEMFYLFSDAVKKEICFDLFESVDNFNQVNVDVLLFMFNSHDARFDENAPLWYWKGAEQLCVYAMKQDLPVLNKLQSCGASGIGCMPSNRKMLELILCARLVKLLPHSSLQTLTPPFKNYVHGLVPQAMELTKMRFKFLLGPQVWQLVRSARDAVRAMVRSKLFPQIQMMSMGEFEELHGYPLSRKQQEQFHKRIFFLSGDLMDRDSNMLISDWEINTILEELLAMDTCVIDLTISKRRGTFADALGHLLVLTEYLLERRAQGKMLRVKVTLLAKVIAKCRIMVTRPPNTNDYALTEALLPYSRRFFNQASLFVRENLAQKALLCYSQDSWSTIKCGFYIDLVLTEYLLERRAQGEMLQVNVTLLAKVIAKRALTKELLAGPPRVELWLNFSRGHHYFVMLPMVRGGNRCYC